MPKRPIAFWLLSLSVVLLCGHQQTFAQQPAAPTATPPAAGNQPADGKPADGKPAGEGAAAGEKSAGSEGEAKAGDAAAGTADAAGSESNKKADDKQAEADEGDGFWNSGALGLLRQGGIFMWPIAIMGVLATAVIIERYRSLKMVNTRSREIRDRVHRLLREDRVEEALKLCDEHQGPVPAVLSCGLRKYYVLKRLNYEPGRIEEQVIKAMDDYSEHIVAALEKHLAILATVSSAAPTLGFLGTVQGMIVAFADIVAKMGETNIVEAAAGGIQVSLLTTCFGLIVGIPAFVAFNYFSSVINAYVLDVKESSTDLIESVTLQMAVSHASSAEHQPVQP